MHAYNYESFPLDMDEADFSRYPEIHHVGDPAPDGTLVDAADGNRVKLFDYLKKGPLVIEFGSIT